MIFFYFSHMNTSFGPWCYSCRAMWVWISCGCHVWASATFFELNWIEDQNVWTDRTLVICVRKNEKKKMWWEKRRWRVENGRRCLLVSNMIPGQTSANIMWLYHYPDNIPKWQRRYLHCLCMAHTAMTIYVARNTPGMQQHEDLHLRNATARQDES